MGSTAHVVLDGKALATDVKATIDGKDAQDVQGVKVRDTPQHRDTTQHRDTEDDHAPFSACFQPANASGAAPPSPSHA